MTDRTRTKRLQSKERHKVKHKHKHTKRLLCSAKEKHSPYHTDICRSLCRSYRDQRSKMSQLSVTKYQREQNSLAVLIRQSHRYSESWVSVSSCMFKFYVCRSGLMMLMLCSSEICNWLVLVSYLVAGV